MERPGDRGVGRDGAEQGTTDAQVLDVEAALPATGEHECHLGEDLPAVVDRDSVAAPGNGRREGIAKPHPISERTQRVQPDVGHDSLPTEFHLDATSAGTVHLGSALLLGDCWVSTTTVSPTGRAFPRTRRVQLNGRREELGLSSIPFL